ncbi:bacterioferritin-associated ferredoxin [Klebsiella pneumoniae]|uniref:Bacterioferritin-associated ferredoxin n=1 Tax=Klebsiella pneumoniae TaxID=573 RepID=A0A378FQK6_KLEPN|nr:bacterioferritin-associated ferredoxin [Klebsiella pneumoniae]
MYVCLCNGVSDKKIRQVVRQFQPQSFQQLRKFVPVGNQCGKCVRAAREVMEDELTTMPGIQRNRLKSTLLFDIPIGRTTLQ